MLRQVLHSASCELRKLTGKFLVYCRHQPALAKDASSSSPRPQSTAGYVVLRTTAMPRTDHLPIDRHARQHVSYLLGRNLWKPSLPPRRHVAGRPAYSISIYPAVATRAVPITLVAHPFPHLQRPCPPFPAMASCRHLIATPTPTRATRCRVERCTCRPLYTAATTT